MTYLRALFSGTKSIVLLAAALALAACATPRYERVTPNPHYKVGKPYKINGRWYRPAHDPDYDEIGVASWYGPQFHGRKTANGEIFDMNLLSAAHTTLPMPSMAEVENLENGRRVTVRVNDRGPFAGDRMIDLSREAARRLGFEKQGLARVRVRYLGPAPLRAQAPSNQADATRYAAYAAQKHPQRRTQATHMATAMPVAAQPAATVFETAPPPQIIKANLEVETPAARVVEPQPVVAPAPVPVAVASAGALVDNSPVDKLYVIRIAALSKLDNLSALEAQMEPIGPLRLSRVEVADNKVLYRITMGPFRSAEEAAAPLEAVRRAGYADAVIVAVTP